MQPKLPKTERFYLTQECSDDFQQNGDFEVVLTLKKNGGVDIYLKPDLIHKDIVLIHSQKEEKEDELFKGEAKDQNGTSLSVGKAFKMLGHAPGYAPNAPAEEKESYAARIKEIVENRKIAITGVPISWSTLQPGKPNGSQCFTMYLGGECHINA